MLVKHNKNYGASMSDLLKEMIDFVGKEYFLKNGKKNNEVVRVREEIKVIHQHKLFPDFDHITMI